MAGRAKLAGLLITGAALAGGCIPVPAVATVLPASISIVAPVKGNGPGLKNWRCHDYGPANWYGPWRYTKGGALIDCAQYGV